MSHINELILWYNPKPQRPQYKSPGFHKILSHFYLNPVFTVYLPNISTTNYPNLVTKIEGLSKLMSKIPSEEDLKVALSVYRPQNVCR